MQSGFTNKTQRTARRESSGLADAYVSPVSRERDFIFRFQIPWCEPGLPPSNSPMRKIAATVGIHSPFIVDSIESGFNFGRPRSDPN